jgi:hypothetical protein
MITRTFNGYDTYWQVEGFNILLDSYEKAKLVRDYLKENESLTYKLLVAQEYVK